MAEPAQPSATRAEPIDPELLRLAAKAMVRVGRADQITVVHEALAAVLPAHEALVRAKVAEEIEAQLAEDDDGSLWGGGMGRAAEIARGEA